MNIKVVKRNIIFIIICSIIIGTYLYISNEHDKNYIVIKPIESIKDIYCGEILSVDQICINYMGKSVKKDDVKNYITSENYKDYIGSIYNKNINKNSNIMITDIE